jgi:hypothetical protein
MKSRTLLLLMPLLPREISIASSRMPTPLLTAQMGNQEELNKAIIEAFMQAKPSYQLDQATINTYGYPPFGIFDKQ